MPFEFSEHKPTEKTFEILNEATGQPVGIRVTVMSVQDERMKAYTRKMTDAAIHRNKRNKTLTAVEMERNHNRSLAHAIVGWEWYDATWHGERPDDTEANKMDVLSSSVSFKRQVEDEVENLESFFET